MPLHPEFETLLAQLAQAGGQPLNELAVEDARAFIIALQPAAPDLTVGALENRVIPGPAGDIPLRIYSPRGDGPFPVLVNFHGGGWVIGNLDTSDGQCRLLCEGARCVVVSVDYRLAPESTFPAAAEDCYAATTWVAKHADEIGADASRLAVGGDSAGGNLAAVVALMARDRSGPQIIFQLLVNPVTDANFDTNSYRANAEGYLLTRDSMIWFWDHYCPPDQRANPYASPLRADDLGNLPPALVLTAEFDPLRDEGEAYAARLEAAGVTTECVRYDGLIHGFFAMAGVFDAGKPSVERACQALKAAFGC